VDFDLRRAIQQVAVPTLPLSASSENQEACLQFIFERLRNLLLEQGGRFDVVDAVLAAQGHNPARAAQAVKALASWTARPDWNTILPAYARCVRITRELAERYPVTPSAFVESAETALYTALQAAEKASPRPGSVDDFFAIFLPLIPPINHYFEAVLVMDDDPTLRQNRLGLLQRIAALANGVADLSKLEGF
jgi:glycyl-tRNA synthetase